MGKIIKQEDYIIKDGNGKIIADLKNGNSMNVEQLTLPPHHHNLEYGFLGEGLKYGDIYELNREVGIQLKDSGDRRHFETGAVRDMAEGKGRCDLLPAAALLRLSKLYEAGAKKYAARNWEKGISISVMIDSGMRHLLKYLDGWTDEDHLTAAAWNILGAMWMEEKHPELQDLPSRVGNTSTDVNIPSRIVRTKELSRRNNISYNERSCYIMDDIYNKVQNAFYELTECQAKMKINSERRKGEEAHTQESIRQNLDNATDLVTQVMLELEVYYKK